MFSKLIGWLLPTKILDAIGGVQEALKGKRTYLAALALAAPALLQIVDAFIGLPAGGFYDFIRAMPNTDAWNHLMQALALAGIRAGVSNEITAATEPLPDDTSAKK
jgi:hypothetical protein